MDYTLLFFASSIAACQALFILYVFSMNVQRVYEQRRMTTWHWLFAGAWVVFAILLDVVLNYTLLAVLTLDFPKSGEYTFSQRLERLVRQDGLRGKVARSIAFVLDPFDPSGKHIK